MKSEYDVTKWQQILAHGLAMANRHNPFWNKSLAMSTFNLHHKKVADTWRNSHWLGVAQ